MINIIQIKAKTSIIAIITIHSLISAPVYAGGQLIGFGTGLGAFDYDTVTISGNGMVVTGEMQIGSFEDGFPIYANAVWTQASGKIRVRELSGGLFGGMVINADGSKFVGSESSAAASWSQSEGLVHLGYLPGEFNSRAFGVSADGSVIVGTSYGSKSEAFIWTQNSGMIGLGDLPGGNFNSRASHVSANGLVVIGESQSAQGYEAFRWTQAGGVVGLNSLFGSYSQSSADGVSSDGSVIVGYSTNGYSSEAFRWTQDDGVVGLGYLNTVDSHSRARGVSGDGTIIVGSSNFYPTQAWTGLEEEAFLWTETDGMISLMDWLVNKNVDMSGFTHLVSAEGISADGKTILGYGFNSAGKREAFIVTVTAVPEPESLAMLMAGLGLIGLIQRRKKQII